MLVVRLDIRGCIQCIDISSGRIDQHFAADVEIPSGNAILRHNPPSLSLILHLHRFHVIGGKTAVIQRRTDESENKACIVIEQVSVRVLQPPDTVVGINDRLHGLDGAGTQIAGRAGISLPYQPVQPGSGPQYHGVVTESAGNRGQKTDFPDGAGKLSH